LCDHRKLQVDKKCLCHIGCGFGHQIPAQKGFLDLAVVEKDHLHKEESDDQCSGQTENDHPAVACLCRTGAGGKDI
jgi:hypothetical protein